MKTASEIRKDFLEFFKSKQHQIVPSSPIFPQDDPTLLFTNAGMNQFKDVFLGTGKRSYKRAADTQKCLRVSGKHNDLESVGRDTYHHTFFEMLGNWSFGDYFKKEAIHWAWEILTEVWQIPKEKLWATVFGGDPKDGLSADEEAVQVWKEETDIAHDRILRFGKKDNFWEMGDSGPCGPCTEIHLDRGKEACDHKDEPGHICNVNGGCARFIEIWNLVFIQFNRQEDQTLVTLPSKHVDTGMGFERLVSVLQNKFSNYDTDVFAPILNEISKITGLSYTAGNSTSDIAFRVLADHIRALSSAFADGALPGNAGRGYVLRRLLRRAARFGRQSLGMQEPFIYRLVPVVADIFKEVFPEIHQRQEHIQLLIKTEEESFGQMLTRGIHLFNELVEEVKKDGKNTIPGERAYRLYHQDGFPRDLVDLMAQEQNLTVDDDGWKKAEKEHIENSKGAKAGYRISPSELEGIPSTHFIGYATMECTANVLKIVDNNTLILDRTPFYAESGGQVGDTGIITGKYFRFQVNDTQKIGDIYLHIGEILEQDLTTPVHRVKACVDKKRRRDIMANHSATHLLHWALRHVLGEHVVQQGSVVEPDRFRFDISHPKKIEDHEILEVERLVNERIYENLKVQKSVETLESAKKKGAMALFGEKYGEKVRVIQIGRYSKELCGGTHTYFTGDLGSFRIVSESSIQAGVRRIEAVTRSKAIEWAQKEHSFLREIKSQLKGVDDNALVAKISSLQDEIKELKKKGTQQAQKDTKAYSQSLLEKAPVIQDVKVVVAKTESMSVGDLRILADMIKKSSFLAAGILACTFQEKVFMVSFLSDKLLEKETPLHAGEMIKIAGSIVEGGGDSRRKEFGQGQGSKADKIDTMLSQISSVIEEKLSNTIKN